MGNKIARTTNGWTWDLIDYAPSGIGWLMSVSGPRSNPNVVWAVGQSDTPARSQIVKTTNGTNWSFQTVPQSILDNNILLRDVAAVDTNTAYAVGDAGTIIKTVAGGEPWTILPSPTSQHLIGVAALDATHVVVVGSNGSIFRTSNGGADWTPDTSGTTAYLKAVAMVDWNTGWAVGENGTILHTTNGSTWTRQISPTAQNLRAVGAANNLTAWTAGAASVVLHTATGGEGAAIAASAYFAEGCTRPGFDEWISLQNPGEERLVVYMQYMYQDETPAAQKAYEVAAGSRASVNVNVEAGAGHDVSAQLWSSGIFYAERSMYFSYASFSSPGEVWTGGSVAAAAASPRSDWYFAEGCTRPGFEEWLTVFNPGATDAVVHYDFIMPGGVKVTKTYLAPAGRRTSAFVNQEAGVGLDVSAHVYSTTPIVVERPMYFNYGGWTGGSDVMGARAPARKWYFAEGCTRDGFQEYLCMQNSGSTDATVTVIYRMPEETTTRDYVVEKNSRRTVWVNDAIGAGRDVSCEISSTASIVVERPMYFLYTGYAAPAWTGGSDVLGATALQDEWFFPEGYTGPGFHEFLCIGNPGTTDATVGVTYNILGGTPKTQTHVVPAGRRYTIFTNTDVGPNLEFSVHVTSSADVVCERAMYFDYHGWNGGSCGTGFSQ